MNMCLTPCTHTVLHTYTVTVNLSINTSVFTFSIKDHYAALLQLLPSSGQESHFHYDIKVQLTSHFHSTNVSAHIKSILT